MANRRLLNSLWGGLLAALALSSCASNPPLAASSAGGGEFAYLAAGARAYFYTDIRFSRPILEHISLQGVDMARAGRFLDKVDFLSAAVYPGGAPQRLLLHAWRGKGNVPSVSALFLSAQWEKTASPTGGNYYHSQSYGLSVSTQGSHAFVSDGDPFAFEPPVAEPEGLAELRWEAVMLGWLDNAGTPINRFLSAVGIPMRVPTDRILFGVYPSRAPDLDGEALDGEAPRRRAAREPLYELRLRVQTENANQAKALASLLAFVRVFAESPDISVAPEYLETLRPLLANPPSQDGPDLAIHTEPMGAGEIALLFNRFSVYSQ
ncbi:MAG: hypothetical protein LBG14_06515 [Treponema sp.]|jgi:hypothetical protein|nr:hypothetical protein [Treponema sp.]